MWLPAKIYDLLQLSKDNADATRTELAVVKAERDILKSQLAVANSQFTWLSMIVNQLEVERAALLEKSAGIKAPVPEIVRSPKPFPKIGELAFQHIDEETAKTLGIEHLLS
jgi:hypothetical protein